MFATKRLKRENLGQLTDSQKAAVKSVVKWTTFFERELSVSPNIVIAFSNALTHTAGHCKRLGETTFRITLSNHFVGQSNFDKTVCHEIAHAFQRVLYPHSKSHGWQWRRIMSMSGYIPDRCHNYAVRPHKLRRTTRPYSCICGQKFYLGLNVQVKIVRGKFYRCRICRQRINFANVFGVKELPVYLRLKLRQVV